MADEPVIPRLVIRNFFGFPKIEEDPEPVIETIPFLEASREVVSAIESFGKLFSPIVNDMQNNIEKIKSVFDKDPEKYKNLEELLVDEKSQRSNYAANSLLWLKRALELISVFFFNVLNDPEEKDVLKDALRDAYNKTLKQYHKWIVQNAFAIIYRWVPTRSQLFGTDDVYIENINFLGSFQQRMHLNIIEITKIIARHGLDDEIRV